MDNAVRNYLKQIGKKGGKTKTDKKAKAARLNGKKGGKPSNKKEAKNGQKI